MRYKQDVSIRHLIHKLKHASANFCGQKGLFSSQVHNLLAVILGAGVGVAGLYISLWDGKIISIPFIHEQKDSYTVAGLQNLGNNCFLNVILQALASSRHFLSFVQNILLSDDLLVGENKENMPLTAVLNSLLKDLSIARDEKTVLNPRRVMLAMSSYASSFNLTRQQDAAEAFLHLLSALEEEILEFYVMHDISLADIIAFPSKIYKPNREGQNECERWKQNFLGPFDGTIGSSLTCKTCSSMVSMDFEFFRCLPLSPVLDGGMEIMAGCTVVDCLKHFTVVEHVENYRCGRCWHTAALKYLLGKEEKDEEKIKKLENCVSLDSCGCNEIFLQEEITWTQFSCASKQLSVARCPRILCIHLQRASMSVYGEFIKLQGYVSFPLFLDLFPFMRVNAGQETSEDYAQKLENQMPNLLMPQLHLKMPQEVHMLSHMYRIVNNKLSSEFLAREMLRNSTTEALSHSPSDTASENNDSHKKAERIFASDLHGPQAGSCSETRLNNKGSAIDSSSSSKQCIYRLSSVVEHYGRPGSGHYAVYRRLDSEGSSETASRRWFYVSDREVSAVSEEAVLAAEASLLFYEMIDTSISSD
ncbi:ubiquitin carboxyl-terminal hydrolase 27 isoform X2 [Asparagus officinalis]|uniref:ubiquitin carboxyl-terminal hydrolase 27 isoform X2 n=1 Tax=Asparagus officinalis TaxID=4686 RepID=UPI00098E2740|nr:ubiquitin carboxyl-terminal hydrolase 27 isoform X2 [Asparagus officinalis]